MKKLSTATIFGVCMIAFSLVIGGCTPLVVCQDNNQCQTGEVCQNNFCVIEPEPPPPPCPMYKIAACQADEVAVGQGFDENGCELPPKCEKLCQTDSDCQSQTGTGYICNQIYCFTTPCDWTCIPDPVISADQIVCEATGGTWETQSCGNYTCGTAPICAALIPGCNCGKDKNFDSFLGCVPDASCVVTSNTCLKDSDCDPGFICNQIYCITTPCDWICIPDPGIIFN